MIILRLFHFKMLPEIHFLTFCMLILFFRILFCHHPITGQRKASCLISNIIGTYWVQARTVWIQIRLQVFFSKIVSMIRKYHNHKPKTNPWHREEEPHNHHETPERQTKQSNQLSLQIQIVLTFQAFVRPSLYSQIGHLLAFFILCCKHMAKHDIHMFGETGEMTFITGKQGTKVKF